MQLTDQRFGVESVFKTIAVRVSRAALQVLSQQTGGSRDANALIAAIRTRIGHIAVFEV